MKGSWIAKYEIKHVRVMNHVFYLIASFDYFITLTLTDFADELPAASLAMTFIVCMPAVTFFGRVFQLVLNVLPVPVAFRASSI